MIKTLIERKNIRLPAYDYRRSAMYYVTICTLGRERYFGKIMNEQITLSAAGQRINDCWIDIPSHHTVATLDEYVIMPNHVHGIIIIENNDEQSDVAGNVPTANRMSNISPKANSLSTIIRSFKSSCTKAIHESLPSLDFSWQPRFYEHIIRNNEDLYRIRQYIRDNPKNWKQDELY